MHRRWICPAWVLSMLLIGGNVACGSTHRTPSERPPGSPQNVRVLVCLMADVGPVKLEIAIDERSVLSDIVQPSFRDPCIAAWRYLTLPRGHHKLSIRDLSNGHNTYTEFQLRKHMNFHVMVAADGITLDTTDNPNEAYD